VDLGDQKWRAQKGDVGDSSPDNGIAGWNGDVDAIPNGCKETEWEMTNKDTKTVGGWIKAWARGVNLRRDQHKKRKGGWGGVGAARVKPTLQE